MDESPTMNFEEQYRTFTEENAWSRVFQLLNKSSYEKFKFNKTTVAKKLKNYDLNRYIDVVPFDDSRIKLSSLENDYINASKIEVEKAGRNYILTQGPLPCTVSHFWLMVWQQNSRAIVMLNKLIENGVDKCYLYWPTKGRNLELPSVDLEVELVSVKEDDQSGDFITREFKLKNLKENSERTIYQFHTLCWPDFDVPRSPESFVKFLFTVRESGYLNSNKYGPAVVHCSAGIGRSGTFILVDSFLILLKKSIEQNRPWPDVLEMLLEMRNYRLGLVQTQNQLRFAYEAIINAKNSELFDREDLHDSEEANETANEPASDPVNEQPKENEKELRRRVREEKNKNTMEQIKRIKDKQKEVENWKKQKVRIKYGLILIIGVSISAGILRTYFV